MVREDASVFSTVVNSSTPYVRKISKAKNKMATNTELEQIFAATKAQDGKAQRSTVDVEDKHPSKSVTVVSTSFSVLVPYASAKTDSSRQVLPFPWRESSKHSVIFYK